MPPSVRLTLVSTSIIAAAVSAMFAWAYSSLEVNISHSIELELPQITILFTTLSLWAMLLPIVLLGAVLVTLRSRYTNAVTLTVSAADIPFALGWLLLCLLLWRLPRVVIGTWIE